jgi:hypothetical protein
MNILLFGATGMVGDGVLRWLIESPRVSRVVAVSRKPLTVQHPKLETVIAPDMFQLQHVNSLRDFDACLFCLGASSVGMSPDDYRRLTYDLTVAVARQLLPRNPRMVFEYISGEGADARSRQCGRRSRLSKCCSSLKYETNCRSTRSMMCFSAFPSNGSFRESRTRLRQMTPWESGVLEGVFPCISLQHAKRSATEHNSLLILQRRINYLERSATERNRRYRFKSSHPHQSFLSHSGFFGFGDAFDPMLASRRAGKETGDAEVLLSARDVPSTAQCLVKRNQVRHRAHLALRKLVLVTSERSFRIQHREEVRQACLILNLR